MCVVSDSFPSMYEFHTVSRICRFNSKISVTLFSCENSSSFSTRETYTRDPQQFARQKRRFHDKIQHLTTNFCFESSPWKLLAEFTEAHSVTIGRREIVRSFVSAEAIRQSSGAGRGRGIETVLLMARWPRDAGRMHRRCNVCRSNRLYNEMNACSLLMENIERSVRPDIVLRQKAGIYIFQ